MKANTKNSDCIIYDIIHVSRKASKSEMPFMLERYHHFRSRNPLIITKINNQPKLTDFEYLSNENWLKLLFRVIWIYLAIPIRLLYFTLQKKASRNVMLFLLVQLSLKKRR